MSKEPEDVLPKDGVAAGCGVVEVGSVEAVNLKLDKCDGEDWQCENNENGGYEGHPCEYGHFRQGHTWSAHVEDGDDEVQTGGD